MSARLAVPLLDELVDGGISYGSMLLVEFEPQSLWYDTAYTIAYQALRNGIRTELHTFHRSPHDVKRILAQFGLEPDRLLSEGLLRIIDSYTVQTGIGTTEKSKGADVFMTSSLKMSDWNAAAVRQIQAGIPEEEKRRLHIDDNMTVLTRYNTEEEMIDSARTRILPLQRSREIVLLNALLKGVTSEVFITQLESLHDGIIDFRSREENGKLEHYVRIRTMHGRSSDSRWQHLRQSEKGLVLLDRSRPKVAELGISGWLKGAKKQ